MPLKNSIDAQDHVEGTIKAPVILVEYGDYQCPYCGLAYPILKKIQERFSTQLSFVFRNFPLSQMHPLAEPAAEAAEFAGEHGHFWEMHDLIYENQKSLSIPILIQLGESLKLPKQELEQAISEQRYLDRIKKDFLGGIRSGVNGTPTLFFNGERYNGNVGYAALVSTIESILVEKI